MTKVTTISGIGYRYISEIPEFKNGLPAGILNKKATDVGGTFAAVSCTSNYIIVCPFIDLVDSIGDDKNAPYPVFKMYGGVTEGSLRQYVADNQVKKIVVTYDSVPKLITWLSKLGVENDFKVLVDEYHLILEDLGFRDKAILNLLDELRFFNHCTFMSATPINDVFLTVELSELPVTIIDWGKEIKIFPTRIQTKSTTKALVRFIGQVMDDKLFLDDINGNRTLVKELYVFCNSVTTIATIIKSCELTGDDIKVVCSDTIRNGQTLGTTSISKMGDPNKAINFFTKKGFQGCNLFTNNGLVIVISDSSKKQTLVDIQTTMYQINGRLRTNKEFNNIFRDKLWHIFSTGFVTKKKDAFETELEETKRKSYEVVSGYAKVSPSERAAMIGCASIDHLFVHYDGISVDYVELKEKYAIYNHNITQEIYSNGLALRTQYSDAGIANEEFNGYNAFDDEVIKSVTTVSFKTLLTQYIELRQNDGDAKLIDRYELENPLFKQAYELLGVDGISTAKFVKDRVESAIKAVAARERVFLELFKGIGTAAFISSAEIKNRLTIIYEKYKLEGKPSATLIKECNFFEAAETVLKINGKATKGYNISRKLKL